MPPRKKMNATSFRLSSECMAQLGRLKAERGLSRTQAIEMAIPLLLDKFERWPKGPKKNPRNPGEGG